MKKRKKHKFENYFKKRFFLFNSSVVFVLIQLGMIKIAALNYTQQKKKVNTYSTLIISYTNSIDGKCNIPYEREIPLL